jgi:hypothetical protein
LPPYQDSSHARPLLARHLRINRARRIQRVGGGSKPDAATSTLLINAKSDPPGCVVPLEDFKRWAEQASE